ALRPKPPGPSGTEGGGTGVVEKPVGTGGGTTSPGGGPAGGAAGGGANPAGGNTGVSSGPVGPSPQDVKKFQTMLDDVNRAIKLKKYDDALTLAGKAKTFAQDQKLGTDYVARAEKLPNQIETAKNNEKNAAFQANAKQSDDLYAKASKAIEAGDYATA